MARLSSRRQLLWALEGILGACLLLIVVIFIKYKNTGWPLDAQSIWCMGAVIVAAAAGVAAGHAARAGKAVAAGGALAGGFALGGLWTAEIAMNNVLHPALPLRDYLDDAFWAVVAGGTLAGSAVAARRSLRAAAASAWGAWSGLASGSVACLTALLFTVFGMRFIAGDPVDQQEWAAQGSTSGYSGINVYWAHQSLVGGIIHLAVLGPLSGMALGLLGGVMRRHRSLRREG